MKSYSRPDAPLRSRLPAADRLEYRLLLWISFTACLVFISARRMISVFAARSGVPEGSVVEEARAAAYAAVGYAFMG